MDPEHKALVERVDAIGKMVEDNNRILHGMRRAAWAGRVTRIVWWVAVFVLSAAVYYYYLAPQLARLEAIYSQIQGGTEQAQGFQQQFADFFRQFQGGQ